MLRTKQNRSLKMRISDEQGYWLAGYLDGEATFNCSIYIPKSKERKRAARNVNIEMRVAARADEYLLLSECRELTGLGNLYYRPKQTGEGYPVNGKPCWVWTVASKADCQALVELLERYPLRSKSAEILRFGRRSLTSRLSVSLPSEGLVSTIQHASKNLLGS